MQRKTFPLQQFTFNPLAACATPGGRSPHIRKSTIEPEIRTVRLNGDTAATGA
jgi:hypothetical protein